MRLRDDDGVELKAEYHVEKVDRRLTLVLESAGGRKGSGRNEDYVPVLRVLLERLRRLGGAITDGAVDSRETQHLPRDQRQLILADREYPVRLVDESNVEDLRLALTRSQRRVGQSATSTGGNNRKRIRLGLDVPGYGADDASRLENDLALPRRDWRADSPTSDQAVRSVPAGPPGRMFRLRPVERTHTARTEYDRSPRTVVVVRAEAALVQSYLRWLSPDSAMRSESVAGISDIFIEGSTGVEIVEAKSTARHLHVRLALGQLLDYARFARGPIDRLTALFPSRPQDLSLELLHNYGIDCVVQAASGFQRIAAPSWRRERARPLWTPGVEA